MNVLVSAFSCGPGWGSEPGIGWNTVEQISRKHDVWVLTEAGWRERMASQFDPLAHPRIHFEWVRIPWLDKLVDGGAWDCGPGWLLYYTLWQNAALQAARRLHRQVSFDLVHHVTFGKHSVPSHLHRLGPPFLFGPVGGAEQSPSVDFYREFPWKVRLAESLRLAHVRLMRFDPWLRICVQRAKRTIGVTVESAMELQKLGARSPQVMPAISLPDGEAHALGAQKRNAGDVTHLLFIGRLLAWKGIHLTLHALAACKQKNVTLRIIGDGPARSHLETQANSLGLAERVHFTGNLARTEVLKALHEADALFFPSLHDSGGYAVIEAMAAGLPIICLDLGGPGQFVTNDCGWKIRPQSLQQTIQDLAIALDACASAPEERLRRGAAARARCLTHYTASAHGNRLDAVYQSLLAEPS